jgi:predicted 2-oxoglutarate/Fe(II)-dependent dioxygenase YbiX/peroxiredoxin
MLLKDMALLPGDPAPAFEARTGGHLAFPFHAVAGRLVILSFLGRLRTPATAAANRHILSRYRAWFDDKKACFFGVCVNEADERDGLLQDQMPGVRYIRDFDLAVSKRYRVAGEEGEGYLPTTFVLDRKMQLLAAITIDVDLKHNAELDRVITGLMNQKVGDAAPVLQVSQVFEPELCSRLIEQYAADGGKPSGFAEDVGGKTVEVLNSKRKRRRDFLVADCTLQDVIRERLHRRLLPAIHQAFQFQVTRIERYLVAHYDAQTSGFFAAHRDNVTLATAHRRFAVTINLNDEFDGGGLMFPEFGSGVYRVPAGSAIVFSCSLMHEAVPVRRGSRFAFLPFLHDEAAEIIRLQHQGFLSSEVLDRN